MSELRFIKHVIRLNSKVGLTSVFSPLILTVLLLAPIVTTLSLRHNLISVKFLPFILEPANKPISIALSQLTDTPATVPVDKDTRRFGSYT